MTQARVDKQWQGKGLEGYSTEALLGTLAHYGVSTSEEAFREAAAAGRYPTQLAQEWTARWKGTGPFGPFPYSAAVELWHRWVKDVAAPEDLTRTLARSMDALAVRAQPGGAADARPPAEVLAPVREVLQRAPAEAAARRTFVQQALAAFGEQALRAFDGLGEGLAGAGRTEDAHAFTQLEEELLPERAGIASALVRAKLGERDEAVRTLVAAADDTGRDTLSRVMAADALIHVGALPDATRALRALLPVVEAGGDVHLALELASRLQHVAQRAGDAAGLAQARADLQRLEAAHDAAHPHHRRHRR